jgi:DNA-directed RNA polymerase subunit F
MADSKIDTVKAVYELREAAVEHGKAVAHLENEPSSTARDEVLTTQTTLEEKTVAAIDECSENAEEAVEAAREEAS